MRQFTSKWLEETESGGKQSSGPCTHPFPYLQNLSGSLGFLLLSRAGNIFSKYSTKFLQIFFFFRFPHSWHLPFADLEHKRVKDLNLYLKQLLSGSRKLANVSISIISFTCTWFQVAFYQKIQEIFHCLFWKKKKKPWVTYLVMMHFGMEPWQHSSKLKTRTSMTEK